ncbi:Uncharacterized protein Fot_08887 [Forsythia ovata]|uniref:Uncharacterized protein n=1 Tax=Forsythia ovata TaxID=205694 RepID=A0ABD1WCP7_9LAMI
MDTPNRRLTRSAANKESPDFVKKTALHSKQKVIFLDTSTYTKDSISEKNRNAHDEGTRGRMSSCSSKEMHKNENVGKHRPDKVAQSSSPKKINQPQPYEAQFYIEDVMEQVEEIIKSAEKYKHSDTIEANIEVVLNGYCGNGAFKYSKLVELVPSNVHHRRYYTLSLSNFNTKVYSIATITDFE